jgi:hypothetical protein
LCFGGEGLSTMLPDASVSVGRHVGQVSNEKESRRYRKIPKG